LSAEEQEEFVEQIDKLKRELEKAHYREHGSMPLYIDLQFAEGPKPPILEAMHHVPYQKSSVIDSFVDSAKGEAVVVLRAQIDYDGARGKQFEYVAYMVDKKGARQIARKCAHELFLLNGEEKVKMDAASLYKAHKAKK
jgi:hypothetical protein